MMIMRFSKLPEFGYLREIRKQIAHDYPNDYNSICLHISIIFTKSNELLNFWREFREKISMK